MSLFHILWVYLPNSTAAETWDAQEGDANIEAFRPIIRLQTVRQKCVVVFLFILFGVPGVEIKSEYIFCSCHKCIYCHFLVKMSWSHFGHFGDIWKAEYDMHIECRINLLCTFIYYYNIYYYLFVKPSKNLVSIYPGGVIYCWHLPARTEQNMGN